MSGTAILRFGTNGTGDAGDNFQFIQPYLIYYVFLFAAFNRGKHAIADTLACRRYPQAHLRGGCDSCKTATKGSLSAGLSIGI